MIYYQYVQNINEIKKIFYGTFFMVIFKMILYHNIDMS